jgi:hypothetical protein
VIYTIDLDQDMGLYETLWIELDPVTIVVTAYGTDLKS